MKSLTALYNDAHAALAAKQHAKYGNPITQAPRHVPGILSGAVKMEYITNAQARKLAVALGRKAYGEYGLTFGIVGMVLDKVCGFYQPGYNARQYLETNLSTY